MNAELSKNVTLKFFIDDNVFECENFGIRHTFEGGELTETVFNCYMLYYPEHTTGGIILYKGGRYEITRSKILKSGGHAFVSGVMTKIKDSITLTICDRKWKIRKFQTLRKVVADKDADYIFSFNIPEKTFRSITIDDDELKYNEKRLRITNFEFNGNISRDPFFLSGTLEVTAVETSNSLDQALENLQKKLTQCGQTERIWSMTDFFNNLENLKKLKDD